MLTALFIGISMWVLATPYPNVFDPRITQGTLLRQAVVSGFTLLMAGLMATAWPKRWLSHRTWILSILLGSLLLITIVSVVWIPRSPYFPWWQGSVGWIVSGLVLIAGLTYALPRLEKSISKRDATWRDRAIGFAPFAGVLVFMVIAPFVLYHNWLVMFLLLFGMLVLTVCTVLQGWARWVAILASIFAFIGRTALLEWPHSRVSELISHLLGGEANWHREQIRQVIQGSGGTSFLIDWPTDFIFVRLIDMGGLSVGLAVMVLAGVWLTLIWRIVGRQWDLNKRTLAASIASVMTIRTLVSIFISTGIWPISGVQFPFLSFGVRLMVIDGFLLGVLLLLSRDDEGLSQERPVLLIQRGVVVFLVFCAGILLGVFLGCPGRFSL